MSTTVIALEALDLAQLRKRWQQVYGTAPPARLRKDVLLLALGWMAQAKTQNGLGRDARDYIAKLGVNLKAGKDLLSAAKPHNKLSPGMGLVREWHGTTHQVLVLEKGFSWKGQVWGSLSQIAREITGARWNGPAFFGLRSSSKAGDGL